MANPSGGSPFGDTPPTPEFLAESRIPEIVFGSIFPAAIATVFIFARFYSRLFIMKNWGWDDSWILFSWLGGGIVLAALNCYLTTLGAGMHLITIKKENAAGLMTYGLVCRILYQFVILTTKYGMCAFYLRIFTDRKSRYFIWCTVAYNTIYTIPLVFTLIFRCNPIQANWSLTPGKCRGDVPPLYASTILNIIGDAALIGFAIPKILRLQIAPRQKASLTAILSMSLLIILAAILRCYYVRQIANSFDVSYNSYSVVIWTSVEVNTGLFCASAPAIKPLLKLIAPGLLSSLGRTTNKVSNYANGTAMSRRVGKTRNDAFELSSQTGLDKAEQGECWADVKGVGGSASDGASEWEHEGGKGEIRKTVKVEVLDSKRDVEFENKPARKFESA